MASGDGQDAGQAGLPTWLTRDEEYEPPRERGNFVTKSMLGMAGVLARMRLDDGQAGPLSPSAPLKLVLGLAMILLTSLSQNYAFDYTPKGDTLEITYNNSTLTMQKQS